MTLFRARFCRSFWGPRLLKAVKDLLKALQGRVHGELIAKAGGERKLDKSWSYTAAPTGIRGYLSNQSASKALFLSASAPSISNCHVDAYDRQSHIQTFDPRALLGKSWCGIPYSSPKQRVETSSLELWNPNDLDIAKRNEFAKLGQRCGWLDVVRTFSASKPLKIYNPDRLRGISGRVSLSAALEIFWAVKRRKLWSSGHNVDVLLYSAISMKSYGEKGPFVPISLIWRESKLGTSARQWYNTFEDIAVFSSNVSK
ncbi:hypothetical protein BT96DRAFT_947912 [Gymnopus androsaceus JB14]|uniref:Uncharacterized protein n=1 Tax=Gymnopus androsaceus JB14 TaxID=1447944 RepID=A0A6A4GQJ0_9AGAR|nr:hypothetical protein BT96DRAFT_947912 [Gymnopus androsaceus JB14]